MPDRSVIHKWAAAGAATVCALPVGADAVALAAEEEAMVINVGKMFGISLSLLKEGEREIIAALKEKFATKAIEAFKVVNTVGYPFNNMPVKIAVTVGVLKALGNAAYSYFEKCSEEGQLD